MSATSPLSALQRRRVRRTGVVLALVVVLIPLSVWLPRLWPTLSR